MVKKTETKKETGKPKAAPAKKARNKKAPVAAEKKEVTKDAPADVVEEVLATPVIDLEKEPKKVEEVVTEVVEQPTETVINVDDETEEKISSYENEEGDVEKVDEEVPSVDDAPVNDEPEEAPEEVKEEQVPTNGPRDISGAKEEFITENAGDEIETENIAVKTVKKSAEGEQPKKKNRIMRYLSYLWNGVEID